MRKCIWCKKTEVETKFEKEAHTVPKSLGGKNICQNVCDSCNMYFGSTQPNYPSIEETFKEVFNLTRVKLLMGFAEHDNKKIQNRFKSRYFDVNLSNRKVKIKSAFKKQMSFHRKLNEAFKRGLYKVFLEEIERQHGCALLEKYDFVRQVARYGIDSYPLFYFYRIDGIVFILQDEIDNPSIFFQKMDYLYNDEYYIEIEFLGHVFGFPINRMYEINIDSSLTKSIEIKKRFFRAYKEIKKITDIDILLKVMDK